jgi:hypothetical protein
MEVSDLQSDIDELLLQLFVGVGITYFRNYSVGAGRA